MPHEISKYVYAILGQGQIIIATLDAEEDQNQMDRRPSVTQLVTGHKYPAAMVFPANDDTWAALQMLYEDIPVPELPLTPNEVMDKLLQQVTYVFAKVSTDSYDDARYNGKMRAVRRRPDGKTSSIDTKNFYVPYDAHGNEIKTV